MKQHETWNIISERFPNCSWNYKTTLFIAQSALWLLRNLLSYRRKNKMRSIDRNSRKFHNWRSWNDWSCGWLNWPSTNMTCHGKPMSDVQFGCEWTLWSTQRDSQRNSIHNCHPISNCIIMCIIFVCFTNRFWTRRLMSFGTVLSTLLFSHIVTTRCVRTADTDFVNE